MAFDREELRIVSGKDERRRHVARHVGTWRRLVVARGPAAAIRVAMIVAELARSDDRGAIIVRPTHQRIAEILDVAVRSVERQFAALVEAGWLQRIGGRPVRGTPQTYRLATRGAVDEATIEAAYSLEAGMWELIANRRKPDTDDGLTPATARHDSQDSPTQNDQQPDKSGGSLTGVTGSNSGERAPESAPAEQERAAGTNIGPRPVRDAVFAEIRSKLGLRPPAATAAEPLNSEAVIEALEGAAANGTHGAGS
jgi:hypothetical protein